MRDGVPFEQDAKFCFYCQTYHFGEHAKFAMPREERDWRKHWPDAAVVQAAEDEARLLTEEGVPG